MYKQPVLGIVLALPPKWQWEADLMGASDGARSTDRADQAAQGDQGTQPGRAVAVRRVQED